MIGKSLGVNIYFTDPYASWQKGAIENANGLIRQYVPKIETFENVSHQQITKYAKKINIRPRNYNLKHHMSAFTNKLSKFALAC